MGVGLKPPLFVVDEDRDAGTGWGTPSSAATVPTTTLKSLRLRSTALRD
jgi:hypothetical protein